jgi:hypothetical protein
MYHATLQNTARLYIPPYILKCRDVFVLLCFCMRSPEVCSAAVKDIFVCPREGDLGSSWKDMFFPARGRFIRLPIYQGEGQGRRKTCLQLYVKVSSMGESGGVTPAADPVHRFAMDL